MKNPGEWEENEWMGKKRTSYLMLRGKWWESKVRCEMEWVKEYLGLRVGGGRKENWRMKRCGRFRSKKNRIDTQFVTRSTQTVCQAVCCIKLADTSRINTRFVTCSGQTVCQAMCCFCELQTYLIRCSSTPTHAYIMRSHFKLNPKRCEH